MGKVKCYLHTKHQPSNTNIEQDVALNSLFLYIIAIFTFLISLMTPFLSIIIAIIVTLYDNRNQSITNLNNL